MSRHHEGPVRRRGSRFDKLGNQFPRTHAARYSVIRTAWRRKVHTGELTCEILASTSGERMVRITAQYVDREGTQIVKPVVCTGEAEEAEVTRELTERIRAQATPRQARRISSWRL